MGLSLTVLGATGSYPGPGGACSGYLVRAGDVCLLLETGPGTISNLQRHVPIGELDAVVVSHSHPDHWSDLAVLRTAWKYGLEREGLRVLGTTETREMAGCLIPSGLLPTIEWDVVADRDVRSIGDVTLSFSRTDHYVETLAVRVEHEGRALAFSADTGPGWSYRAFGAPVDLALCEATYATDEEAEGVLHLSALEAGRMARAAGVGRLVLTHLLPDADPDRYRAAAAETFGAPVEIASVHERYEL